MLYIIVGIVMLISGLIISTALFIFKDDDPNDNMWPDEIWDRDDLDQGGDGK